MAIGVIVAKKQMKDPKWMHNQAPTHAIALLIDDNRYIATFIVAILVVLVLCAEHMYLWFASVSTSLFWRLFVRHVYTTIRGH